MPYTVRVMKKLIALLLTSVAAFAATSTHTLTVFPTRTDWSVTNSIPQWNPADGTLNSVTISVAGNVSSEYLAENRDTIAGTITATTDANVTATSGGVTADAVITPSHSQAVTAFDGVIDYSGTSGLAVTSAATGSDTESAAVLTPFIGTGTVAVSASSSGSATASGPGHLRFIVNTFSSAIVTVTYDFTPNCPPCDDDEEDCRKPRRSPKRCR